MKIRDDCKVDYYHYAALKMMAIARHEEGYCSRMRLAQLLGCSLFDLGPTIKQLKQGYMQIQKDEIECAIERVKEKKGLG